MPASTGSIIFLSGTSKCKTSLKKFVSVMKTL